MYSFVTDALGLIICMSGFVLMVMNRAVAAKIDDSQRTWLKTVFFNNPRRGILIIGSMLMLVGFAISAWQTPYLLWGR